MQCVNCQFENMPGMDHCVRCHSALSLSNVAIMPPRASSWRIATWAAQRWHLIVSTTRALWAVRPGRAATVRTHVVWEAVAWSLIPGMGFIKFGNRLTGKLILSGWCVLMMLMILGLGRTWGSWCLAVAVFLHAMSMIAFLGAELLAHNIVIRALFGMIIFVGLRFLVYEPIGALSRRFYAPLPVAGLYIGSVIQNDDALLYEGPWMRPAKFERGDIVVYDTHGGQYNNFVVAQGLGLDRIIAVPGDGVERDDSGLLINGLPIPPDAGPLGGANIELGRDAIVLGADEYLIFPSRVNLRGYGNMDTAEMIARMIRIPSADIRGRIVLRLHPWSRFGKID